MIRVLQKLVGESLSGPHIKAPNFQGNFRNIFRKKIVAQKQILRAEIRSADAPPKKKVIRWG